MMRRPRYLSHRRSLLRVLGLLSVLVLGSASLANADTAPTLVVTDEGPGVVNTVGVTANTYGTCAYAYEARQGNGAATCPAASWPEPGSQWPPILAMDEGDTLRLTFSSPVSEVIYASTTDYPTGLTDPSGEEVPNVNIIEPIHAKPTASPDVWTASIPKPLSPLASSAVPFAVVARDATEYHDYSLSIEKPYCVVQGEPLTPGTFRCSLSPSNGPGPGPNAGGTHENSGSLPQHSSTTTAGGTITRPVIRIMNVRHLGGDRYRVTVFASRPGRLILTGFQRFRRIARFGRWLKSSRTAFSIRMMAKGVHPRLRIDATFDAEGGGIATATVYTRLRRTTEK
jgi:hypothetical protein